MHVLRNYGVFLGPGYRGKTVIPVPVQLSSREPAVADRRLVPAIER